ncbi:MAG: hypothetical protein LBO67_08755 [Spirochaetaceae bacterium]|jgi:hypothetical protein|nr:hypothetical protein [Spirochaetaceae bacterium]
MSKTDWLPRKEQDFADLCQKWKKGLSDPTNATAFEWKPDDLDEVLIAVDGAFHIGCRSHVSFNACRIRPPFSDTLLLLSYLSLLDKSYCKRLGLYDYLL